MTVSFDPFTQVIQETERFRLKDGNIIKEDKNLRTTLRAKSWLRWIFTYHQYRYTPLLKKMDYIYKDSIKNLQKITNAYIQNYQALIQWAQAHNQKYEKSFWYCFYKIDLSTHQKKLNELKAQQPCGANVSGWWEIEAEDDESILMLENFGNLACPYLRNFLAKISANLTVTDDDNTPKNYALILKTVGLFTIGNFKQKNLTSREAFEKYLQDNQATLTNLIMTNHSNIVKKA